MQDCSKYDIMISASLDGALNRKDAKELEKHLASCADCRRYMQLLETVKEGLHEELPDPPEMLREGIMYKIGLEKHRKLHFGAMGRWTAIAAVLCVVILGVVKLTGSGVMKASAQEAVPMALNSVASGAAGADMEAEKAADSGWLSESKLAAANDMPSQEETLTAESAAGSGSAANGAVRSVPAEPGAMNDALDGPDVGSVYLADSLPGYDTARAALNSGDYWGVCVFYGALPEDLGAGAWQRETPESGEKDRWLLSLSELQALEKGTEWDEFYYGDLNAARGLVIVIAGEEE